MAVYNVQVAVYGYVWTEVEADSPEEAVEMINHSIDVCEFNYDLTEIEDDEPTEVVFVRDEEGNAIWDW
jgi:hypothetical protein